MPALVGKKAPEFVTKAVIGNEIIDNFSLNQYKGKNIVLFFYPLNFTFVCPTELHAFQEALEEFEKRETQLIGCSVDSPFCHIAWLNTPKKEGGIEGIDYPLLSDLNKNIAEDYGILNEEGVAYRGLFLIDRQGIVRHQVVNDLPLGRSVNETLRMIDALHHFEQYGEVCPANWSKGKETMKPDFEGLKKFYANH